MVPRWLFMLSQLDKDDVGETFLLRGTSLAVLVHIVARGKVIGFATVAVTPAAVTVTGVVP